MSNKKFAKRRMKYQSMNSNSPKSKTWRNEDGSFTTAIPIPSIVVNETHALLLLHMASYVAEYLERENIKTINQWDKRADDEDFKIKTFNRIINDYAKTCCSHLNIDMIENAPILLNCVEELMNFKREWCDSLVTPKTNFKYEWLPILRTYAIIIIGHIEKYAAEIIENYNKRMNEQKVA